MSDALEFLTIAGAARLIERRALSPVELTEALIARAGALDPLLHAYLRPDFDAARAAARAAEAEIAAGRYRGPLHGVPYGLKDVFDAAGLPTTGASRAYAGRVAGRDAGVTARLRAAGAVLLGKLNTHEGAHGGPSFDLAWPPARNPWDLDRFTGGSSSGSGAAVAAGLMPLALGSDTGGSIRNPAALCGLVGLKPSYGLVSRRGVMPNAFSLDHAGPLTRTAEDAAIALGALAGHDPEDPTSVDRPVPDFRAALTGELRGVRIGVLRHLAEEEDGVPAPVAAALEEAYAVLRSLGAVLEEARIRPSSEYNDVKIAIAESEILAVHEAALRADAGAFGEDFLARVLPAILFRGSDVVQAQRRRRIMMAEFDALHRRFDLLVTAAPGPAPRLDAHRPLSFWSKPSSLVTPFSVGGGPALSGCIGFSGGLPMAMQIAGRPFEDATVLRAADAHERATGHRARRPALDPRLTAGAPPPAPVAVPDPAPSTLSAAEEGAIRDLLRHAGIDPPERAVRHLLAAAPHARAMAARLAASPLAMESEPAYVLGRRTAAETGAPGT